MIQSQSDVLCGNVFDNIISKYINIKDIYNLSLLCRQLYLRINEKYIAKCLENNINNFFLHRCVRVSLKPPPYIPPAKLYLLGPNFIQRMLDNDSKVDRYEMVDIEDILDNITGYEDSKYVNIHFKNYRHIINKIGTFTIKNVSSFYRIIREYSSIGFKFKPKYNRLLCLEYILLKNRRLYGFIEKYNIDKKKKSSWMAECSRTHLCPMNLLFKDVKHYHDVRHIIIDKNNNMFNNLIINNKESESFRRMFKTCKSLDQYVKERNWFVAANNSISPYDANDKTYDVSITF